MTIIPRFLEVRMPSAHHWISRSGLACLMALVLLVALAVPATEADASEAVSEVRVAARRMPNGDTEFALQVRETATTWSALQKPSARYLPADAAVGQWLASSPMTLFDSAIQTRIVVMRHSDGKLEFAIQQDRPDGSWGERVLPRARILPATVHSRGWLVSTAVTIAMAHPLPPPVQSSPSSSTNPTGTLIITAFCNLEDPPLPERDCSAAAASGLDPNKHWALWASGVVDWDRVRYSFGDSVPGYSRGGAFLSVDERGLTLRGLAIGEYSISIREEQPSGWTEWSAPYTFVIRDATVATRSKLTITAFCNLEDPPLTEAECHSAASVGLVAHVDWQLWATGYEEASKLRYRLNNGRVRLTAQDLTLEFLVPGSHTIQIREGQAAGWTRWSDPYEFIMRASDPSQRPGRAVAVAFLEQASEYVLGYKTEMRSLGSARSEKIVYEAISKRAMAYSDALRSRYDLSSCGEACDGALDKISLAAAAYSNAAGWRGNYAFVARESYLAHYSAAVRRGNAYLREAEAHIDQCRATPD